VRVLVRRSSPRTNIAPTDDVVVGDICDRASLVAALRGVRYLKDCVYVHPPERSVVGLPSSLSKSG
jgi:hypothetical protein